VSLSSGLDRPARGGAWAVALIVPALAACVWSEQFRQAHRLVVNLDDLPLKLAGWQGKVATPDPVVSEMLKCDQLLCRRYTDDWGHEVEVHVMFWATPASTAHMHHPDICWTCQGWQAEASHVRPVRYADDRAPLGVSARHFVRKDKWQVVYYWTQNGRTVLPDGQEPAGHSEYAWIGTLLRGRQTLARTSRLSVLLGANVNVGRTDLPAAKLKQQEAKMEQLAAALAADLYRLCPWAEPEE
jgi:EpsI family protein